MAVIVAVPVIMAVVMRMIMRMTVGMPMMMVTVIMTMTVAVTMPVGANPHHMMMMPDLRCCNVAFISNDLFAIFAKLAVHIVVAGVNFSQAFGKAFQHQRMIAQIFRLDEFNILEFGRDFVCMGVNPVDQNASKQEIREYHHTLVAKLHGFAQTGIDTRMGNPGITDFGTSETKPFL